MASKHSIAVTVAFELSHAGGPDLGAAFANAALAMFNYMTPLSGLKSKDEHKR